MGKKSRKKCERAGIFSQKVNKPWYSHKSFCSGRGRNTFFNNWVLQFHEQKGNQHCQIPLLSFALFSSKISESCFSEIIL
jgi:hypothetical protein